MAQRQAEDRPWLVDDETLVRPFVRGLGSDAVLIPSAWIARSGAPTRPPGPTVAGAAPGPLVGGPPGPTRDTAPAATARRRLVTAVLGVLLVIGAAFLLLRPAPAEPSAAPAPTVSRPDLPAPVPGSPAGGGPTTSPPRAANPTATAPRPVVSAPAPDGSTATHQGGGRAAAASGTLHAGDSGPAVARLQQLLFGQGKTYVAVTGTFDSATVQAVREVQQERSITADPAGVYGPATRTALEQN
ncbi:peptidoglycan-binding protein [Kitasatospora sp. NPDC059571]|uniref:peptidoglycan-binding domain-containing protein n=1 Tax=Kitasatospora sp. NPDC059571 TaxID=3346871 RepID=UPI003685C122